jgi:hypothetical protein
MAFAGINYVAVILAAVASFVFGSLWYGILGRQWAAALGRSREELAPGGRPSASQLIIGFVAQLVMAWMLAGAIGHLGPGQVTIGNGVVSGAAIWFGFVLTSLVVNHAFQRQRPSLTAIDGAHWLGVLVIDGAVIGAMGLSAAA